MRVIANRAPFGRPRLQDRRTDGRHSQAAYWIGSLRLGMTGLRGMIPTAIGTGRGTRVCFLSQMPPVDLSHSGVVLAIGNCA
jgi:hypothetical protein